MLTFEEKQRLIEQYYPQLVKKSVSMKRINYHLEESLQDKTTVVQYLHPNGNAFVYVGDHSNYESDERGLVNVREFTENEFLRVIQHAIDYLMTEHEPVHETWVNRDGEILELREELEVMNVYFNDQLEESFGDYQEAVSYLEEEQFKRKE